MLGKSPLQSYEDLFRSSLTQIINLNHPLVLLSNKIDWNEVEQKLPPYYSQHGRKSMSIPKFGSVKKADFLRSD